jgi:hypothetical protein
MTALRRLARAQAILTGATLVYGALWGAAAAALLRAGLGLSGAVPGVMAAVVGIVIIWQNRRVRSSQAVALWLECRVPELRYALVTLAEGQANGVSGALEETVARTRWADPIRRALLRRMLLPVLLLLVATLVLLLLPAATGNRASASVDSSTGSETRNSETDPFRSFVVTVTPPVYARQPQVQLEQPEAISSLVGSSISVVGRGWEVSTTMPDTATPFWLERNGSRRLLVLLPVPDSVPAVTLVIPSRDSVLRIVGGTVPLVSSFRDDFGVSSAWFEYIVSAGEGENFTFRSGVIGRRSLGNVNRAELSSRLSLDSLKLAPGNIVHLRAVARDGNTVSGPGIGYSETRTFRVPRPGEGDSVAVNQVARAEGDSSLLSQRILLMMAEALERRRPRLRRDTFVAESRRIAGEQATLRRRVADIIFLRLGAEGSMEEGDSTAEPLTPDALLEAAEQATVTSTGEALDFSSDETPVVALNRPLLEAYNAMWAAGRELEIGEPRRALPHMREALEAIQRARQAERIYLRGRPATAVIDLAKVRLAGSLAGAAPAPTGSHTRDRKIRESLLYRFSIALGLLPDPAIIDSLQLLRIDALENEPRFAAALGEAVTAARNGRDATEAMVRARRLLAGPVQVQAGLKPWDFAP